MRNVLFILFIVVFFLISPISSFAKNTNNPSVDNTTMLDLEVDMFERERAKCYFFTVNKMYGQDKIWFEVYDYNKDGKADWVRYVDYPAGSVLGDTSIEFYRGDKHQLFMIGEYASLQNGPYTAIAFKEMGICRYGGSLAEFDFKPVKDENLNNLFLMVDRFLSKNSKIRKKALEEIGDFLKNTRVSSLLVNWQ